MTWFVRPLAGVALVAGGVFALAAAGFSGLEERRARELARVAHAEDLAAFVELALRHREDLRIVERLARAGARDHVRFACVLGGDGRVRFHSRVAEVGRVARGERVARALAARETISQAARGAAPAEVDVPLDAGGVLRMAFSDAPLSPARRWRWTGTAAAFALLAATGGLLLVRKS